MTASSIDLYSRQVQLIGLPPQTAASTAGVTNVNVVMRPIRPTFSSVRRVSRNLFGSPEKGEITEMLRKSTQRKLNYMRERYQVDLDMLKNAEANTALPTLIAKEQQIYEQRIKQEKCNLNRDSITSSDDAENTSAKVKQVTQIKRTSNVDDAALCCSERGKPYARQTLLTDCFNKRKSTPLPPVAAVAAAATLNGCDANVRHAVTLKSTSPNALEVLELPNPMRATLSLCTSSATGATTTSAQSVLTTIAATVLETTCDVPIIATIAETNIETPHA